jgi:hypothetical protein
MTKLKVSKSGREGNTITYWNPKGYKTREGEVLKVLVWLDEMGNPINNYEITYAEGNLYMGDGRTVAVTELPKDIKLIDE